MTADPNGWPDPTRPGVPLNPECSRWHILIHARDGIVCEQWIGSDELPDDLHGWNAISQKNAKDDHRYVGPVLMPSEAAAREAAAWCAGRDATAQAHWQALLSLRQGSQEYDASRDVARQRDEYAAMIDAITPPADAGTALARMLADAERKGMERAAEIAAIVGRPVGAGDGNTYVPGTSSLSAAAIRAAAQKEAGDE
jgi:hypothetical protein